MTRSLHCGEIERLELVDKCVSRSLDPDERDAFEEHYFACERCARAVSALQAARDVLEEARSPSASRSRRSLIWSAAAAVFAAAVVLILIAIPRGIEPASVVAWRELVPIEAPEYRPVNLRGNETQAREAFRRAMAAYDEADYETALPGLEAAYRQEPTAEHGFFLGATLLLVDRDRRGTDTLEQVVTLGETPYQEEARLYLARARLRRGEVEAAASDLEWIVEQEGELENEARRLLSLIEERTDE